MTREESIKRIQDFMGWFKKNKPLYEALEMAIQALSQEPCETIHGSTYGGVSWGGAYKPQEPCDDAISQHYVEGIVEELENICYNAPQEVLELLSKIRNAPPVTQKPMECDDAVSRKDVINAIDKWISEYKPQHYLIQSIRELPSVTQKSGKWIRTPLLTCDRCNKINKSGEETDYCPTCGAKMVEPQESEDKE